MIDLHCHILPGIDDGSGNLGDTAEMAELAVSAGVEMICATPHCNIPGSYQNYWDDKLERLLIHAQAEFNRRNIPLHLCPGQEVFLSAPFLSLLRAGKFMTLNRSNYLLVEFSMGERGSAAVDKLLQLRAEGYTPIVAHPERYGFVMENPDAPEQLKSAGALLQVNRGSIQGRFGPGQMAAVHQILHRRLADFVASDAHSPYSRTPYLADIHEWISENLSFDYADLLLEHNPRHVINNESIFPC